MGALSNSKTFGSFVTNNLEAARAFYAGTLGITVKDSPMGILELHVKGNEPIIIYPKPDHVPATFTVLNFRIGHIDAVVDELISKGITFEQYPQLGTDEKGISRGRGPAIAWFKDPAGNILSVIEQS